MLLAFHLFLKLFYSFLIEKLKEQWLKEKKVIDSAGAVKRNIEKLKAQIEINKKNPSMSLSLEQKYSQMLDMEQKLQAIQEQSGKKRLLKEEVDEDDIANIVAKWTGIPVNRLMEDESKKLIGMEKVQGNFSLQLLILRIL